jgi:exodeoxyribonuclease III
MTTLATWNVNSLKVRLPQVLDWLRANPVDALCLQELKLTDEAFPSIELLAAGYNAVFTGQKMYNGVAILTPVTQPHVRDVQYNLPNFEDSQRRLIAATLNDGTRVICGYFPNGQAVGSDKYQYKLAWLDALNDYVREQMLHYPRLALGGDYNIAPTDADVHDPQAWQDQLHCSVPERQRFQGLIDLGLSDAYRCFEQLPRSYSWWNYRLLGFQKNKGLRIDHWLVSDAIRATLLACSVDRAPRKWVQPSDHAPVVVKFA